MAKMIQRALGVGAAFAVALGVGGCNRETTPQTEPNGFSLFDGAGPSGWPLDGGELAWPQDASRSLPVLSAAVPMTAAVHNRYSFAPAFDYDPHEPDYYEPSSDYYDSSPDEDSYAWLSFAAMLFETVAVSPPDYYFEYAGIKPWVWETSDHYLLYAEPIPVGYRYYYYAPGTDWPFFVRDPYYSYGYREERLVVIYDSYGRIIDGDRSPLQRDAASRYFARGEGLYDAYSGGEKYGVSAPLWASRESVIERDLGTWQGARQRNADWRDWERQRTPRVEAAWGAETAARQFAGRRFDAWRKSRFQEPAPNFNAEVKRDPAFQRAALQQSRRAPSPRFVRGGDAREIAAGQASGKRPEWPERSAGRDFTNQVGARLRTDQDGPPTSRRQERQAAFRSDHNSAQQEAVARERGRARHEAATGERGRAQQEAMARERGRAQQTQHEALARDRGRAQQAQHEAMARERGRAQQAQREDMARERGRAQQAQQAQQAAMAQERPEAGRGHVERPAPQQVDRSAVVQNQRQQPEAGGRGGNRGKNNK